MEPGICEPTRGQKGDRTIEKAEKKEKRWGGGERKKSGGDSAYIPQGRGVGRETTTRRAGPGFDKGSSRERKRETER